MGKVYDALRRAEQQRARRIDESAGAAVVPAAAPVAEPFLSESAAPVAPAPSAPKGRLGWRNVRPGIDMAGESAGELNKRRIALLQPDSYIAEQFRTLRARIDAMAGARAIHSIAVTSALPGDGKTIAAIGLAAVSAMSVSRRVLLVDCDLRKPTIAASLGLRVDAGLAEVLTGEASLEEAVVGVEGTTLSVLPVRSIPQNPSELLASRRMQELMEQLSEYDRVILDMPPTLGLPDAKIISQLCDGVLFVVRAGVTPSSEVESALEVIDRERVLGLIMNAAEPVTGRYEAAV